MPVLALPIPHGEQSKRNIYRRRYEDPLRQPMSGQVTITSLRRIEHDTTVLPENSAAVVEVVDGWLEVELQPGFYKLVATLTSVSGHTLVDTDSITVTG
jgi:hypothetical protein